MKEKLKTRDLIYAGAFGAIYLLLVLALVMGSGMIPILYILCPLTVGVICATVYMLYVTKIRKFGAILILAVLFGIVTSSNSVFSLVWAVVMGLLAEFIARSGKYQSKRLFKISYWVFNLNMIGPFLMLIYGKAQFIEMCEEYYGAEYAAAIDSLTPNWIIAALAALAVVGAMLGTVLAGKLIGKHFEKAGVV